MFEGSVCFWAKTFLIYFFDFLVSKIKKKNRTSRRQTMANFVANLFLFHVTLFGLIFQGSDGVKDVHLEGPRYARRGEDLMLRCNYDLESDSLYAVKWYRGSEEFYRFLPKESPPKQAFPINGVVVDVKESDDHGVLIRNVSFETNGRFKCIVSAEITFQTLNDAKDVEVVVIDYNSPRLSLDKMGYQPGEKGVANCSIEGTYPAPNITWFINGKQVHVSVSTKVVPVTEETLLRRGGYYTTPYSYGGYGYAVTNTGGRGVVTTTERNVDGRKRDYHGALGMEGTGRKLTSSVSTLVFPIQNYSPLTIKCTGQLYDVYNETSTTQIQPKAPQLNQYNSNTRDASGASTQKYGLPNQLHTLNQTSLANDATHLVHCSPLFTFIGVITLIITTTAAQFPKVSHLPLYQRLVG